MQTGKGGSAGDQDSVHAAPVQKNVSAGPRCGARVRSANAEPLSCATAGNAAVSNEISVVILTFRPERISHHSRIEANSTTITQTIKNAATPASSLSFTAIRAAAAALATPGGSVPALRCIEQQSRVRQKPERRIGRTRSSDSPR